MGFWNGVAAIAAGAAMSLRGRAAVQQIVNFKVGRAKRMIDELVEEIVSNQSRELAGAILDEFGNQLQAAETREFQDEVNDLLWYFKESFMMRQAGGTRPQLR